MDNIFFWIKCSKFKIPPSAPSSINRMCLVLNVYYIFLSAPVWFDSKLVRLLRMMLVARHLNCSSRHFDMCAQRTQYIYILNWAKGYYIWKPHLRTCLGEQEIDEIRCARNATSIVQRARRAEEAAETRVCVCVCVIGLRRLRVSHTHTHTLKSPCVSVYMYVFLMLDLRVN